MNNINEMEEKKLIYIMNHYSKNSVQHFYHIINLLKRIADNGIKIALIIEKCDDDLDLNYPNIKVYAQKEKGKISRTKELYKIVKQLVLSGYKRVYIRISTYATLITLLCTKKYGAKVYYWQSGDAFGYYKSLSFIKRIKWYIKSYIIYYLIKENVDYFVTGPEYMLDYYSNEGKVKKDKLCLLYNDIDISRFRPPTEEEKRELRKKIGLDENKTYILQVHRFSDYRKTTYYIPYINEFARNDKSIEFLIIGSGGDEEDLLKEKIKKSGLLNIKMLGSKPNATIQNYYKACDIFINPSNSEGFPRVVIEAMASGLPIVATSAGGTINLFGDLQKNFVVPVDDRDMLSEKLQIMINDKELQRKCGIENRNGVDKYSTENVAKMYVNLIFVGEKK